jgi:hypothetical protein
VEMQVRRQVSSEEVGANRVLPKALQNSPYAATLAPGLHKKIARGKSSDKIANGVNGGVSRGNGSGSGSGSISGSISGSGSGYARRVRGERPSAAAGSGSGTGGESHSHTHLHAHSSSSSSSGVPTDLFAPSLNQREVIFE